MTNPQTEVVASEWGLLLVAIAPVAQSDRAVASKAQG